MTMSDAQILDTLRKVSAPLLTELTRRGYAVRLVVPASGVAPEHQAVRRDARPADGDSSALRGA